MNYAEVERRLRSGSIVILDGGIGTELERRGVPMDPEAWCGPAALEQVDVLESIHRDYIAAGADVITVNTYASSQLLLRPAGFAGQFKDINQAAEFARAPIGLGAYRFESWESGRSISLLANHDLRCK